MSLFDTMLISTVRAWLRASHSSQEMAVAHPDCQMGEHDVCLSALRPFGKGFVIIVRASTRQESVSYQKIYFEHARRVGNNGRSIRSGVDGSSQGQMDSQHMRGLMSGRGPVLARSSIPQEIYHI